MLIRAVLIACFIVQALAGWSASATLSMCSPEICGVEQLQAATSSESSCGGCCDLTPSEPEPSSPDGQSCCECDPLVCAMCPGCAGRLWSVPPATLIATNRQIDVADAPATSEPWTHMLQPSRVFARAVAAKVSRGPEPERARLCIWTI